MEVPEEGPPGANSRAESSSSCILAAEIGTGLVARHPESMRAFLNLAGGASASFIALARLSDERLRTASLSRYLGRDIFMSLALAFATPSTALSASAVSASAVSDDDDAAAADDDHTNDDCACFHCCCDCHIFLLLPLFS